MANTRVEDAVAISGVLEEMVQAIAERDTPGFAKLLTELEDASLWDLEHRYDGAVAVQAWITGLLQIVPPDALYSASTPRIILRPDGDDDAAWVSTSWSWAVWEGRATAEMRREDGEWRFYRIDFFGVKYVQPEEDMDPRWAMDTIGAAAATLDGTAAAIANRDIPSLAVLALPSFYLVDADRSLVDDPMQTVGALAASGALDGFVPATTRLYIDATAGLALAYDPNGADDALQLLLEGEDASWGLAAAAQGAYEFPEWLGVSPRGLMFTTLGHLKSR